jgi:hypothetical protein
MFPSGPVNLFQTEFNAMTSVGAKLQVVATRTPDGGLYSIVKPSFPITVGDMKGTLKLQLATDDKAKADVTIYNVMAGLNVNVAAGEGTVIGGFDYATNNASANVKLHLPISQPDYKPILDLASVFHHGRYALGGRIFYPFSGQDPRVEAKFQTRSEDSYVVLHAMQTGNDQPLLGLSFLHQLTPGRQLATKVQLHPGRSFLSERVDVMLATANKVNPDTLLKARFSTARGTVGVAVATALSDNLVFEAGAELPANMAAGSTYNLKFIYGTP